MLAHNYKTALVTGASKGLGKSIATHLAEAGLDLVLVARSQNKLEELADNLAETYGVKTQVIVADLAKSDAADKIYEAVRKLGWEVDVLVNNAGFGMYGKFAEHLPYSIDEIMAVNMASLVKLTHLFLPDMLARNRGKVVNLASLAAYMPGPYMALYFATKAFVLSFSVGVNRELAGTAVSVAAICPGPTDSEFGQNTHMTESQPYHSGRKYPSAEVVSRLVLRSLNSRKSIWLTPRDGLLAQLVSLLPKDFAARMVVKYFTRRKDYP